MSCSINMDFGNFLEYNFVGGKSVHFRHPVPHLCPLARPLQNKKSFGENHAT